MTNRSLLIQERIDAVFLDLVSTALERHALTASPTTEFYLVRLLAGFARNAPAALGEALGVELVSTIDLEPGLRYRRLKELADTTLFLTGIFIDHVEARAAATDYYFDLGRRAYLDLHSLDGSYVEPSDALAETYYDLSLRFEEFACVLTSIADRNLFPIRRRLAGIYRQWLEGGENRYRRRLLAAGIPLAGDTDGSRH